MVTCEFLLTAITPIEDQPRCNGIDSDPRCTIERGHLGRTGEGLLAECVGEVVRIQSEQLGIEEVHHGPRDLLEALEQGARQKNRRTGVDAEMRIQIRHRYR